MGTSSCLSATAPINVSPPSWTCLPTRRRCAAFVGSRNRFTDSWEGGEHEILPFPLQMINVGREAAMKARYEGKVEEGGMAAGQISGMIRSIKPAGQIVRDVIAEAMAVLQDGLYLR